MDRYILQPLETKDESPLYQIWYQGEKVLIEGESAQLLKSSLLQAKIDYNDRLQLILQEYVSTESHVHHQEASP